MRTVGLLTLAMWLAIGILGALVGGGIGAAIGFATGLVLLPGALLCLVLSASGGKPAWRRLAA
ncbi:MAG: hypothetical protein EON56_00535 [Alphaproteobacteria bacterium]|nr:MAG: hypothetical protein EON56_00535 [Alphaproteobacteria bacterium]